MTGSVIAARARAPWRVLADADLERLDEGVMRTLEEVGVLFPSARALRVLSASGARVDEAQGLVRLPRAVVREALAAAPRGLLLAGRDPACDLVLDGGSSYLTNDASGFQVLDHATGELRPSTLQDVADSARVVDALPQLACCWGPIVAAGDVPLPVRAVHESAAVLAGTSKHYQAVTTVGEAPARYLVELAAAVAGGHEELRRRPLVSLVQCPVDPLGNDAVALEAALVAAGHGVPCGFLSLTLGGGTAPVTPAGNLVVNMAGVLAGLTLLELASPGAPVFVGSAPSQMDLRSGGYTGGGPEDHLMAAAAVQLAHFYGLPVAVGTMATGAKLADWQAAVDDALSTFASLMSGADLMNGAGLLDGSKTLSYPHLVMESEVFGIVARMGEGIVVDDETLALDAIAAAGPGGTFLGQKHTRRHLRELWQPRVWDRSTWERWLAGGRAGALEAATAEVLRILAEHRPAPLDEAVATGLEAVVAGAEAELLS